MPVTTCGIQITKDLDLSQYLEICQRDFPDLLHRLDAELVREGDFLADYYARLDQYSKHFEDEGDGGRGGAYRRAQKKEPLIRRQGIAALFDLFEDVAPLSPDLFVLDVLGGNGTLARAMKLIRTDAGTPTIFIGDPSPDMIADALALGLPAVRQTASRLLLADRSVDGVLYAYGTHHIAPAERDLAFSEAFRVIRPGGKVVVQDFEEGTPTARWYSDLLHRYTTTGHDCDHFTPESLQRHLNEAGFEDVRVFMIYDPFVLERATQQEAHRDILEHVLVLFGLDVLLPSQGGKIESWQEVEEILRPYTSFSPSQLPHGVATVTDFQVTRRGENWRAEIPRVALVATGRRPQ